MIGTITYILARAGWRAMNGTIADERRRLAGAEPPAAYVSYDPRLLAGVGWYGYRIAFKGGDRQMIERARYMLSERYTIRDSYEYYADGVYVIGVLLRQRVPHYGIGGGAPTPEPDALNFYMPNGGTIKLTKNGSPTAVELEYSLDGCKTWNEWQEVSSVRSLTLQAGQKMWLRNKSATQTGFSTSGSDYYQFLFTSDVYSDGDIDSLLCKYPNIVSTIPSFCFLYLFAACVSLITAPKLMAETIYTGGYNLLFYNCSSLVSVPELKMKYLSDYACNSMFNGCTSLKNIPLLEPLVIPSRGYSYMFQRCNSLNFIRTLMTNISALNCIEAWTHGVSPQGDFYCPAELTIPTGDSGIPSGWTRHDI